MWITRDKMCDCVILHTRTPYLDEYSEWSSYGEYAVFSTTGFKKLFPNTKLPRKGSCREIAGLNIVEKGE